MKPVLETIQPSFGSSFAVRKFHTQNNQKPLWHFHPEYELVYVANGSGKRHIGQHISYYRNGELLLLGPNLPHLTFANQSGQEQTEIVVQLKADFMGSDFLDTPEMMAIRQLLHKAKGGISFPSKVKKHIGERLEYLLQLPQFSKLLCLLDILQELAQVTDYQLLNAEGLTVEVNVQERERMIVIHEYIQNHFEEAITLDDIAQEVHMTVPAFCRYFKKLTNTTFTKFVNDFRIAQACKLLAEEDTSIAGVAFEVGFNNLSHFNKMFKEIMGKSPTEYREETGGFVM
ncbi:MAG: AraC family transcriptional regulator [Chitinophagales bacterium]